MKKILFHLLFFVCTNSFCQTFIVTEDNLIVNRDTSALYEICGDTVSIDVNSDNIIDFTIRHTCPIETCCRTVHYQECIPNKSNYISIRAHNNFETFNYGIYTEWIDNFHYNDTLEKHQGIWSNGGLIVAANFNGQPACSPIEFGNWWWGYSGYIIFRNPNNDAPVYGWIEIQTTMPGDRGFQIFGFGIEDKKISGLVDNRLDGIKILCENDQISLTNIKNKINISLIDLYGRIVYKQNITSDTNITIDHLKSGLFILQISDGQSTIVKKIIK